jgi:hypothetical protein
MKKLLFGILTGLCGTRAAISIYDFFVHLESDSSFIDVIEASTVPMLWLAGAVISLALTYREIFNHLKESNDAIKHAGEELKRSGK